MVVRHGTPGEYGALLAGVIRLQSPRDGLSADKIRGRLLFLHRCNFQARPVSHRAPRARMSAGAWHETRLSRPFDVAGTSRTAPTSTGIGTRSNRKSQQSLPASRTATPLCRVASAHQFAPATAGGMGFSPCGKPPACRNNVVTTEFCA